MNAVAYLRVSDDIQLEKFGGTGLERQEEECRKWAAVNKAEIIEVFREEGVPGWKEENDRPAFLRLLCFVKEHPGTVVIVEALDRLARSYGTQERILKRCIEEDIDLYAANTGENVTEAYMADPMRRALIQIQGIFAELDKNLIVQKLRKGINRKRIQDGEARGYTGEDALRYGRCDGRKSFGDPAYPGEKDTLDLILSYRREGIKTDRIAELLNHQGIPTRFKRPWIGQTVRKILQAQKRVSNESQNLQERT